MNDDEFEKKLRALTGARHRPDPTPAWKAEILARARREAGADARAGKRTRPPRWLVAAWGVAWAAILVMNFTTPRDPQPRSTPEIATANSTPTPHAPARGDSSALLAFHHHLNLNLDFPQ